jgi:hypothetical protein
MKNHAKASGKLIDYKVFLTEKGKKLAHLQLEDERRRVSWVLVPAHLFKKAEERVEAAFALQQEIAAVGTTEELGTGPRLVASELEFT